MKTFHNRIKSLTLAVVATSLMALMVSCNQWIDPNINTDPNNPTNVSVTSILPAAQGALAFANGGQMSRFACMLTQQYLGTDRQHAGYYEYLITENDVGGSIWDLYYSSVMKNASTMISQAPTSPAYRGAGRIIVSYAAAALTDAWGNIPYTEIFRLQRNGTGTFTAKFDDQQAVYAALQAQLDTAITELGVSTNVTSLATSIGGVPVDAFYAGDRSQWIRAAWTLKARLAIHTVKRNGNAAAQDALRFLQRGFTSNADDMMFAFGNAATTPNPLAGFMRDRADIDIGPGMERALNTLRDPRTPAFAAVDVGNVSAGNFDGFGPLVASNNSPVVLLSYSEAKFIEAEANQRLGNTPAARTAFIDAVNASLSATGVGAADAKAYTDQTSVVPASGITLQRIIEQKYIALFTQPEVWTDWRRTGFPALTPVSGNAVPRRLPVPQNERLYNGANVPAGSNQP
ncbi:MAG: SusD/RagB family nutrient-binding outer membrane lipoprotein, partial [Candidatus Kapaibacterium sp.]